MFQGGGCKAIAYVGAYEEARNNGIGFSHVAGTSAGAIFAALIAAGATPEQLVHIVHSDEIRKIPILHKSTQRCGQIIIPLIVLSALFIVYHFFSPCLTTMIFLALVSLAIMLSSRIILGLIFNFGIYDSQNIELIVNQWLNNILQHSEIKDIKFKDLPLHLTVFSCNVTDKKIKKWSSDNNPDLSVAKAVAASCSIPIYFSPTIINETYYVDGGLLINRPDIIHDNFPNYFQALSFKLNSTDSSITNVWHYIKALIKTLIDGADALQHSPRNTENITFGHDGVNNVEIEIGTINATDFKSLNESKINQMLDAGRNGMKQFIKQTDRMLDNNDSNVFTASANRIINEEDYALNQVAFWSYDKCDQIIVSDETLDWIWPLFPTIVSWFENKVSVFVHYSYTPDNDNESDKEKHNAKIRLLNAFGIVHTHTPISDLIKGYFFRNGNKHKCILFDRHSSNGKIHFSAKIYNSDIDSIFISSIINKVTTPQTPAPRNLKSIELKTADIDTITSLIAEIGAYKKNGVNKNNITYHKLYAKDLCFLKKEVRSLKYKELRILSPLFKQAGIDLYSPAYIILPNGQQSIMTPIIVEKHDDKYVVIKGNARCLRLYKDNGEKALVPAFVIDTSLPLANRDFYKISQLHISEKKNRGIVWLKPILS